MILKKESAIPRGLDFFIGVFVFATCLLPCSICVGKKLSCIR
jgi:hypothetical protein